jgi:hypothetical protein
MSDWSEDEEQDRWPVRYPVEAHLQDRSGRFRERTPSRWERTEKIQTAELQKRLLWLLLAAEMGMALAAACLLPLVFLNLSIEQEGVVGAILTGLGEWLGLSRQVTCLVLALPIPILLLVLSLNLWWFRRIRRASEKARSHKGNE